MGTIRGALRNKMSRSFPSFPWPLGAIAIKAVDDGRELMSLVITCLQPPIIKMNHGMKSILQKEQSAECNNSDFVDQTLSAVCNCVYVFVMRSSGSRVRGRTG